ncbi:MAG: hypothetical protein AUG51_19845 [Acidobacteria bacterium 13_1_20CM_3_53_8]|nr:MAG: hypothetical protein AUG51_19845 [Acidobacteria bacterium 13_1_20CM_3_53_8]
MSEKYEDAQLILKLYDLRREEVMRKARNWYFAEFNPESVQDVFSILMGEKSAYLRMVMTYWDMAASLVNNGAIDPKMFADSNGEQIGVFLKLEPFIEDMRRAFDAPNYLENLERCIKSMPDAEDTLARARERFKKFRALREEAMKKAAGESQ